MKEYKNYTYEQRAQIVGELIEEINEYRMWKEKEDELQATLTCQNIANVLLKAVDSIYCIMNTERGINVRRLYYEDGVQDRIMKVVVDIYEKIKNLEFVPNSGEKSIAATITYIRKTLEFEMKNYFKTMKSHNKKHFSIDQLMVDRDGDVMESTIADPKNRTEERMQELLEERVISILKQMSDLDKDQEFINLLFIQKIIGREYKKKEIAELLGCSPSYVTKKEKQLREKILPVIKEELGL